MKYLCSLFLLCLTGVVCARPPHDHVVHPNPTIEHQEFLTEYGMGVQRLPIDGGRIYGWKLNDRITFGRFKGENDGVGFSFDLNHRERLEFTNDGIRWRRAIGGGH